MLESRLLEPFTKAKYLSEQNYQRYVAIINYLYIQHEIYYSPPSLPIDIFNHIISNDKLGVFKEYNLTKLETDLNALEEWGNVMSHPDTGHVTRIEDFNKRKLRYQCTEETIELERMMEKLNSKINMVRGSMDSGLVKALTTLLLELEDYTGEEKYVNLEEQKDVSKLWEDMFTRFDNLRKETSDYLGVIHSRNIEDAMQNKKINAFRIKFTNYLTDFIITIQRNIHIIEDVISVMDKSKALDLVIATLIKKQKEKPTLEDDMSDDEYREIFMNQWKGLVRWFVRDDFNERYVDYLLKQTNDTISRFTKYLQQLSERELQSKNRKKQFLHVADLFETEEGFDICQKAFGTITNVEKPLHFQSSKVREVNTEDTLYNHTPEIISIKDAKDRNKPIKKKMAAIELSDEDKDIQEQLKRRKEYEEQELSALMNCGIVEIKELEEVEPFVRNALLNWISMAVGKEKMKGKTEQGIKYEIEKQSASWISMNCTDGTLRMPDYVLFFEV
ncbi:hypothetical protein AJ85_18070 [Alkalihalobacillus alcalophilus ATCC 27647 = CGMCC 1.3604]|uniref:TIGR02677 family protein n=1 Tax=Alkalihalobacillus alcalophilus ATCC 27647 = CGMCC 1.3604 TaxID=1218173 RepID=A0A094WDQ0_ALKAL|nr:TIGR02677 family protein [Alkalihalobacillus alcalophilus]KGA95874.1 hypothetical protein BALCAV_0219685 [Alkalihalobacillus alcalophilus ATCC 27647 = CGMCC 1.3604]MED1560562.1 TIGR02677 family protein [Alkalihalobacillus alcalophilus]THG89373.1 hypothetical protein AJ85_18070 [Alkalihalobacillus alcalophilus ATCC 27647 = CGMCC 1.3604]